MAILTALSAVKGAMAIAEATGASDWLGDLLGGSKAAEVAGDVLAIASELTGEKKPEDALAVIQQDPAKALELKERLISHKERLIELANSDRADARAMQTQALKQADPVARRFIYYFAWFWAVMACSYLAAITFIAIPEDNIRFADSTQGFVLGTIVAAIVQYFYGASDRGSGNE